MSRVNLVTLNAGADSFVTALNTLLATLTDPTVVGVQFNVDEQQRRDQRQYSAFISADTGGAALGTPFKVRVDEASSIDALKTAIDAWQLANGSFFFASTVYIFKYTGSRTPRFIGITIYNETAGASANYVPK